MTTLREAAQQALEALVHDQMGIAGPRWNSRKEMTSEAILALRAALAEPPCATQDCMPSRCSNCASLEDQNTELDRKLAELTEAVLRSNGIGEKQ